MGKFASNASGTIWWANLQLMQVAPSGTKFATNACGAMLLLNLIQVTESISGSVVPLAMFFYESARPLSSKRENPNQIWPFENGSERNDDFKDMTKEKYLMNDDTFKIGGGLI